MDPHQRPNRPATTLCPANKTRQPNVGFNAGPLSPYLAMNHSTLDSAFCWRWCVHRVQHDTDPISFKCWASVAGAGHYPVSPSEYFILAEVRTHNYMLASVLHNCPTLDKCMLHRYIAGSMVGLCGIDYKHKI